MVTRTIRVRSWLPVVLVAAVFLLQVFSPARAILFVFIALASVLFISWLWARALARCRQDERGAGRSRVQPMPSMPLASRPAFFQAGQGLCLLEQVVVERDGCPHDLIL